MNHSIIETAVDIDASPGKVWRVFTDPEVTRQIGGEYVSGWETGSAFGWKGTDGVQYTNGTILELAPAKLLRHNLYGADGISVLSEITYTFEEHQGHTTLAATEVLNREADNDTYVQMLEGWNAALLSVKELAEKL